MGQGQCEYWWTMFQAMIEMNSLPYCLFVVVFSPFKKHLFNCITKRTLIKNCINLTLNHETLFTRTRTVWNTHVSTIKLWNTGLSKHNCCPRKPFRIPAGEIRCHAKSVSSAAMPSLPLLVHKVYLRRKKTPQKSKTKPSLETPLILSEKKKFNLDSGTVDVPLRHSDLTTNTSTRSSCNVSWCAVL